jgi:O-antigen/teichoic acid export membrane protein
MSKKAVLLNSLSGVVALVTNVLVALVMTPVLVRELGDRGYGIWELLVGFVGYLGVLDLGIGPALVRYVADAWSREDRAALNRIFNTGLLSLLASGVVSVGLFALLAIWGDRILPVTESELQDTVLALLLFGMTLAVSLPRTALSAYLLGMQAHRFVNMIQIATTLVVYGTIYWLLMGGLTNPLTWMSLVFLLGAIAQSVALLFWVLVIDGRTRISFGSFDVSALRDLLSFGIKNMTMAAATGLLQRLSSFAIAYTSGVGAVVYFAIPNRLVEYARLLGTQLGFPLTPYFADLFGKADVAAARSAYFQTTRLLQVVMFIVLVLLVCLGEPFIRLWLGAEYADNGAPILYLLSLGLAAQAVVSNDARVLLSLNRHGPVAAYCLVCAPLCFAASIGLGWLYGANGVAAAVTAYAVGQSALAVTLTCRALGVPLTQYFVGTVWRFVLPIAAAGVGVAVLRVIHYPTGYAELMLYGCFGAAVYAALVWLVALDAGEREFFVRLATRRRSVSAPAPR